MYTEVHVNTIPKMFRPVLKPQMGLGFVMFRHDNGDDDHDDHNVFLNNNGDNNYDPVARCKHISNIPETIVPQQRYLRVV